MVAPPGGCRISSRGGMLLTVTVTVDDVVLPAASRARALMACAPLVVVRESHTISYGAAASSLLIGAPSRRNCTPATASSSVASARTMTLPATVLPAAGAVTATVGGVSGATVVNVTGVASLPAI